MSNVLPLSAFQNGRPRGVASEKMILLTSAHRATAKRLNDAYAAITGDQPTLEQRIEIILAKEFERRDAVAIAAFISKTSNTADHQMMGRHSDDQDVYDCATLSTMACLDNESIEVLAQHFCPEAIPPSPLVELIEKHRTLRQSCTDLEDVADPDWLEEQWKAETQAFVEVVDYACMTINEVRLKADYVYASAELKRRVFDEVEPGTWPMDFLKSLTTAGAQA